MIFKQGPMNCDLWRSHIQGFIQTPPGGGVITPQFSCDTPNHLKFKGGYQGGVYGGCLCDCDGMGNKRGQILT